MKMEIHCRSEQLSLTWKLTVSSQQGRIVTVFQKLTKVITLTNVACFRSSFRHLKLKKKIKNKKAQQLSSLQTNPLEAASTWFVITFTLKAEAFKNLYQLLSSPLSLFKSHFQKRRKSKLNYTSVPCDVRKGKALNLTLSSSCWGKCYITAGLNKELTSSLTAGSRFVLVWPLLCTPSTAARVFYSAWALPRGLRIEAWNAVWATEAQTEQCFPQITENRPWLQLALLQNAQMGKITVH